MTINAEMKLYDDKIHAELQQTKARLEHLEARAKEKKAQAEIDAVKALGNTKQLMQNKRQELQKAIRPEASQIKSEIGCGNGQIQDIHRASSRPSSETRSTIKFSSLPRATPKLP